MAVALQGVLFTYLRNNRLIKMMEDVVNPARNVNIDVLQSWAGEDGFIRNCTNLTIKRSSLRLCT
jgi:hypothetical protein